MFVSPTRTLLTRTHGSTELLLPLMLQAFIPPHPHQCGAVYTSDVSTMPDQFLLQVGTTRQSVSTFTCPFDARECDIIINNIIVAVIEIKVLSVCCILLWRLFFIY